MRAIRLVPTAAAAAFGVVTLGALGASAPAAADDGGADRAGPVGAAAYAFGVTPSSIAAGGQVTLSAGGCPGAATVTSSVLGTVVVQPGQTVQATVSRRADPGATYDVSFVCNGTSGTARLTIVGRGGGLPTTSSTSLPSRTASAAAVTSPSPTVSASPPRGVRGGLGGSIGGMSNAEVAGGAALVAVAVAGTFYAVRRRAADRHQH
ncbi:hypothetical protein [Streptomyces sp. NPDC058657]|uniref:hypothetical protein n=1 Tax=unclassified Streptomyces TaxID=2593676 RepID=UPI003654AA53